MPKIIPFTDAKETRGLGQSRHVLEPLQKQREEEFAVAWHEAHLEDLTRLESLGKNRVRNLLHPLQRRRNLKAWLSRHGFSTPVTARYAHERDAKSHKNQRELEREAVVQGAHYFRISLLRWPDKARAKADQILREYEAPGDLIRICDEQATSRGATTNLIDWLAHRHTEAEPYGATDEQLIALLAWNAEHTQQLTQQNEHLTGLFTRYQQKTAQAVSEGKLDAAWLNTPPQAETIVIGDVLDEGFLGRKRIGLYSDDTRELHIWPYCEPEDEIESTVIHEITHSKGSFEDHWLIEAFIERFTCILDGRNPDNPLGSYVIERRIAQQLFDGAIKPIGDREASSCFVGDDKAVNQQRLTDLLRDAYDGLDVLTTVQNVMKETMPKENYNLLTRSEQLEVLRAMLRCASEIKLISIVRREHPDMPLAHVLELLHKDLTQKEDHNQVIALKHVIALYAPLLEQEAL